MICLSVRNPWALAIFLGKDIENRDWFSSYRGPLAIHASKTMTRRYFDDAVDFMRRIGTHFPYTFEETRDSFNGKVLGMVEMIGCVESSQSNWFQGKFGFVLANPNLLDKPVPALGLLGFWEWDPAVLSHAVAGEHGAESRITSHPSLRTTLLQDGPTAKETITKGDRLV